MKKLTGFIAALFVALLLLASPASAYTTYTSRSGSDPYSTTTGHFLNKGTTTATYAYYSFSCPNIYGQGTLRVRVYKDYTYSTGIGGQSKVLDFSATGYTVSGKREVVQDNNIFEYAQFNFSSSSNSQHCHFDVSIHN